MNLVSNLKSQENIVYLPDNVNERMFEARILLEEHFGLLVQLENLKDRNFCFLREISEQESFHQLVRKIAIAIRKFEIQRIKSNAKSSETYPPEIYECIEFKNALQEIVNKFQEYKKNV